MLLRNNHTFIIINSTEIKSSHQRQRERHILLGHSTYHIAAIPRALMCVSLDKSCNLVSLLDNNYMLCHASDPASPWYHKMPQQRNQETKAYTSLS